MKIPPSALSALTVAAIATAGLLTAAPASAQQYDRSYRDWSVYTHQGECYIGTAPVEESGNPGQRAQPYLLVAHRGRNQDEINVSSGYAYQAGSEVSVALGKQRFQLFTQGDTAWAKDAKQDAALVTAMKRGERLTVQGVSQQGAQTQETYSLIGFSAAYKRMKSLCR